MKHSDYVAQQMRDPEYRRVWRRLWLWRLCQNIEARILQALAKGRG